VNLELQGITKRFGSLVANDHIDLSVTPGTIHALLGENGAGKTTLMNILYGLTQPDEGTILADGKPLTIHSPKDAIAAGIGMVHQHFMLVPVFTVAENVTLGDEETRALGLLDRRRMRRKVRELSERYGLRVDPDALTGDLPVGVQQRVEILKALVRDAQVLILDEPTAVLTPGETEDLFRIMRELRASGRAIVFISHKLKEVQAIADTITILRRGRVVGERPRHTSEDELAALMVGRSVQLRVAKTAAKPGRVMLDVRDLVVPGGHEGLPGAEHTAAVNGLSFRVRAGEILGVAGVQGNGQTELCEALMGLLPVTSGSVHLNDHDITNAAPAMRLRSGSGISRRTGSRTGSSAPSRCPRTSSWTPTTGRRSRPGRPSTWARSARRRNAGSRNSTSGPSRSRRRSKRCPAATSRRSSSPVRWAARSGCCWPASRPAAWTSARSSSCTGASSRNATRAWPSCSCPPSWTRSTPCRTGSLSCTRAGSPGSGRPTCRSKSWAC